MKRLLRICFDSLLLSLIPVLSWFTLAYIVDSRLINVFTLIYPLQFIFYALTSVFATGANIQSELEEDKNATMSGMVLGIVFGFIIYGTVVLNIDSYISFMNMDVEFYRTFSIYAIVQLYIQVIFYFVITKLYYESEDKKANNYSIIFNLINYIVLVSMVLLTKNMIVSTMITLLFISIYVLYIFSNNTEKFKFKPSFRFVKYNSAELFNNIGYTLIFLFGFRVAFEYGPEFIEALAFAALITDTQWDIATSITTLAKIDIAENNFNYRESIHNAYLLIMILFASIFFMFILLFNNYNISLPIVIAYLSFDITSFLLYPIYEIKSAYLQLKSSALVNTSNKVISKVVRFILSLLATPFCTGIGQIGSAIYQYFTYNIIFTKHFKIKRNGTVVER